MAIPDITTLSDDDLAARLNECYAETARRRVLATAPAVAEQANADYVAAIGRIDGDPWVQPTGAHDAYRADATVTHGGKTWVSTTPANVWEPGVSGWREKPSTDPDTGEETVPEFVPPTGGHDAYKTGDRVTFEGKVWESLIDNNVWSPAANPAGWKLIG